MKFHPQSLRTVAQQCRNLEKLDCSLDLSALNNPPERLNGDAGPRFPKLRSLHLKNAYPEMLNWLLYPNVDSLEDVFVILFHPRRFANSLQSMLTQIAQVSISTIGRQWHI